MKLNHMLPSLIIDNLRNCFPAYSVLCGEYLMPYPGGGLFADVPDNIVSQDSMSLVNASRGFVQLIFNGMMAVLLTCSPLKIVGAVVRFLSVKVIHLRQIIRIFNKGRGYQAVNEKLLAFAVLAKQHVMIALPGLPLLENPALDRAQGAPAVRNEAIKRPDTSCGRNLILRLITLNRQPHFIVHDVPPYLELDNSTGNETSQEVFASGGE